MTEVKREGAGKLFFVLHTCRNCQWCGTAGEAAAGSYAMDCAGLIEAEMLDMCA